MVAVKTAGPMSMNDIKEKARNFGIDAGKMKKVELVRAIQKAEGYNACYGTTNGTCTQTHCCWRSDCLKIRLTFNITDRATHFNDNDVHILTEVEDL